MYNKGVQTNHVFMPRKSTVSKSTATAPKAPRKTRTRKTAAATQKNVIVKSPALSKQAIADCIAAETRSLKPVAKKSTVMIAKKTTLKRPGTSKLITPQRYWADIQTRWAIHNFEIQELLKDFSKGFEIVKPYHKQMVEMVTK